MALLVAWANAEGQQPQEPLSQVVIVANEEEPASLPLALYYASRRQIPTNQICRVRVRAAETITRTEFRDQLQQPLLRFLNQQGYLVQSPRTTSAGLPSLETTRSRVAVLVLIHGVPLRIESDPNLVEKLPGPQPKPMQRNEAAVDSELALLPLTGLPLTGALRNPYFGSEHAFGAPLNQQQLLVGRLDGPGPATVRQLVDQALLVEQIGLHGRACFDLRGIQEGGYKAGDDWLRKAADLVRQAGYETDLEETDALWAGDAPLSDVAIYSGWYSLHVAGPFRREGFRFQPGAVAYHIHSSSAASLRAQASYWAGPLLARGAAVTMGNVYEPYLLMTPHLDRFYARLLAGASFIEAAYASQPVLSWQTTFVGDPLYRPFAVPLQEQIARLQVQRRPELEWAYLRQVNLLAASGQQTAALALCRRQQELLQSLILLEKLGDLQPPALAVPVYRQLLGLQTDPARLLRVSLKLARAYERNQQPALALAVYEGLVRAHPQHSLLPQFYTRARDLAAAAGLAGQATQWQEKLQELSAAGQKTGP